MMTLFHSVSELIGQTPLLKLHKLDTGVCELFLKLENQNPGGSIKDRVALSMINEAEKQGLLKPGGTLVKATAGNTGLGLALIAAQKGYELNLVVPDKMSREKISICVHWVPKWFSPAPTSIKVIRPTIRITLVAWQKRRRGPSILTSLITRLTRWPISPPPRQSCSGRWKSVSTQ